MGRLALVALLGVVASARDAHADHMSCVKLRPVVLPSDNSSALPLNAKLWHLGGKEGAYAYHSGPTTITVQSQLFDSNESYPVYVYPLRELVANTSYFPEGSGLAVAFVTGDAADAQPPERPTLAGVYAELGYQPLERMPVASLYLDLRHDADTALVRITIRDRMQSTSSLVITPDLRFICEPGMRLAPGAATITVVAIDLAGNESKPWTSDFTIADPTTRDPLGHVEPRSGSMALIMFGPVLLAAILLGILLIATLRHWRVRGEPGETVSLLVADHVARVVLRRATSLGVASVAGVAGACVLDQWLLGIVIALLACVPISTLIAARRVLRLVERADTHAEVRESMLVVGGPGGSARLATSHRVIDDARRKALPSAALQRDI